MSLRNDLVSDFLATFDAPAVIGDELLMIDLATAHTCLDIAEMTRSPERARKNVELAREALLATERHFTAVGPNDGLRNTIEQSRHQLRLRLAVLEQRFPPPFPADSVQSSAGTG